MKNVKASFLIWRQKFFGHQFWWRILLWTFGFIMFEFGLAFIIVSRLGYATYDALLTPLRILVQVSDPRVYGTYLLIPAGIFLTFASLGLHYWQTKKVRIDYVLAIIPIVCGGIVLDQILRINFISNILIQTNTKWPLATYPAAIGWALMGAPLFAIGIGVMSGTKIMPNPFAMIVDETAQLIRKSFKRTQLFYDGAFIMFGILMTLFNIIYKNRDGIPGHEHALTWPYALHYIGPLTIIVLTTQGFLIGHTKMYLEKKFFHVRPN